MGSKPRRRYNRWASVMKSGLSSRSRAYPASPAAAIRPSSSADPAPVPRCDGSTYMARCGEGPQGTRPCGRRGLGRSRLASGIDRPGRCVRAARDRRYTNETDVRRPFPLTASGEDARACSNVTRPGQDMPAAPGMLELPQRRPRLSQKRGTTESACLLYTSDAADEEDSVDLGGRRI